MSGIEVSQIKRRQEGEVRLGNAADAAALAKLGGEAFYAAYHENTPPADMALHLKTIYSEEEQARRLGDSKTFFFIKMVDGAPAAYIRVVESTPPPCVSGRNPIEFADMYMRTELQRHGVGTELYNAAIGEALSRGYETAWWSVWEINQKSLSFCAKLPCRRVGRLDYPVGNDIQKDIVFEMALRCEQV